MAKMSKKVKSLILAAIILVVLGGILTLLLLLPNDSDSADSSSAGATSSDASIVLIDKEQKNVKNINIKIAFHRSIDKFLCIFYRFQHNFSLFHNKQLLFTECTNRIFPSVF